jgi:hypothetical protein
MRPFADRMSVRRLDPEQAKSQLRPGDLAIFFSEHFDRFRDCCQQLKQRGVGTLYLVDGILEWRNAWENRPDEPACPWTMRTVLSHKVACIGPSQQRVLDQWGNCEKTEVVGIPRLDEQRQRFLASPDFEKKTVRDSGVFRLMVATAKTPGFTDAQIATTLEMLRDIQQFVAAHPQTADGRQIEVWWRIAEPLTSDLQIENRTTDLSGNELSRQLAEVDAVLTTPSTLMLEAALAQRPTALLNYHNTPTYVPAAWQVQHRSHLPQVIGELAEVPPVKMAYQQMCLRDALQCDEDATARLEKLVHGMLQEMQVCRQAHQPLHFSTQILPATHSLSAKLDLPHLYPQFPELGFDSTEQLAAEWVQSRREIEHLHRELKQAKSELAEAHRIFSQIHRHPIAGPIVRIRQTVLDWIQTSPKQVINKGNSKSPETVSETSR